MADNTNEQKQLDGTQQSTEEPKQANLTSKGTENPKQEDQIKDKFFHQQIEERLHNQIVRQQATIKETFNDFKVMEIDEHGKLVEYTDEVVEEQEYQPLDETLKEVENHFQIKFTMQSRHVFKSGPVLSKEVRTEIHQYFKKTAFATVTRDNCIFTDKKKESNRREGVVRFCLQKTDTSHFAALDQLAKFFHIKTGRFSYSGTKDKKAVTTQLVAVSRISAHRLRQFVHSRIKLSGFVPNSSHLFLGSHTGNRFEIVIRHLSNPAVVLNNFFCVCRNGFLNYFGSQRFGANSETPTAQTGFFLFCQAWSLAYSGITGKTAADDESAKKHISTMPLHLRTLFLHAFQSFLWNKALSSLSAVSETLCLPGSILWDPVFLPFLTELNLSLEQFRTLSEQSRLPGSPRQTIVHPTNPQAHCIDDTTLFVSFSLPTSAYATTFLNELLILNK